MNGICFKKLFNMFSSKLEKHKNILYLKRLKMSQENVDNSNPSFNLKIPIYRKEKAVINAVFP